MLLLLLLLLLFFVVVCPLWLCRRLRLGCERKQSCSLALTGHFKWGGNLRALKIETERAGVHQTI